MNWTFLKIIHTRLIKRAVFLVIIIPLVYDIFKNLGRVDIFKHMFSLYYIVLLGAIFYIFAYVLTFLFLPDVIKEYNNHKQYEEWCQKRSKDYLAKLKSKGVFSSLDNHQLKSIFPEYIRYIPLSDAMKIYSSTELTSIYAEIEYKLANKKSIWIRLMLSLLFIAALGMIFLPFLNRLCSILWGE